MQEIKRVTFVGAGNLSTQLAKVLYSKGISINQIYSRTEESAQLLAEQVGAKFTHDLTQLTADADLYFFSVKDDALEQVLCDFPHRNSKIVHTAGSIPMSILKDFSSIYGVFYPLQTFSKLRDVDFHYIPFCIESSEEAFTLQLKNLAGKLSNDVRDVDSNQRQSVHLAAVFVCNFVNYMYTIGHDLMMDSDLDFNLLRPLIQETAQKVMHANPREMQTGPAVRFDEKVMNKHLDFLKNKEELQELYKFVSKQIFKNYKLGTTEK
ncbi:MAG: Rossmann-like and DUF2520 domain-containing protein [Mangrovibacterium sp.]